MDDTKEKVKGAMENTDTRLAGVGQRVFRELIKTPAFKEAVLVSLKGINADDAAGFVRAFLWEDPVFSLSIFGIIPDLVNYLVEMILEYGRQFGSMPAPLLKDFILNLTRGIETERLAQLPEVYGPFMDDVVWKDPVVVEGMLRGLGAMGSSYMEFSGQTLSKISSHVQAAGNGHEAYLDRDAVGSAVNSSLRLFNQSMDKNPDNLKDLVSKVDREEFKRAATTVFNMVLDSILPISKWYMGALISRSKRIFSRNKKARI